MCEAYIESKIVGSIHKYEVFDFNRWEEENIIIR
jgi:hypothetical protein